MEEWGDCLENLIKSWKQGLSRQERWDINGWRKEDEDQEEHSNPPKTLRRAAKERIIKEALEKGEVLDLDAIYEDGKLFGRKLRYLDYEDAEGNPDVCRFVVFDYKEKPYKVRLKFNFEDSVIDLWVGEYCERIGNNVGASTAITFKELCNETKEIANKIFEDKAKMIIAATRRNLGEYD